MAEKKRFYFDYAASTPVDPEVERLMRPYFLEKFGNAGSLHSFGQEAMAAIDHSREMIANAIGAQFREIIFTGSATEANNLALRGVVRNVLSAGTFKHPRIIVSAIEHESILKTARDLELDGCEVAIIPVSSDGIIDLKKFEKVLDEKTVLVSVMYANNEIGTVQPIAEISNIIRNFRDGSYPLFHSDAVQAFQFFNCNVNELGVDFMTLSAHKIYGPKGIGALYRKDKGARHLAPIVTGGGQEYGFRSGTENVPFIVGFGNAVELVVKHREKEGKRISELRDTFWSGLKKIAPKAEINGSLTSRLPHILNIYFPDHDAQDLLTRFDLAGIAVSAGSACIARSAEPSYVIEALGYPKERARKSIRFSFGRPTTSEEIDHALEIIKKMKL